MTHLTGRDGLAIGLALGLLLGLAIGRNVNAVSPQLPDPEPSLAPVPTIAGAPSVLASAGQADSELRGASPLQPHSSVGVPPSSSPAATASSAAAKSKPATPSPTRAPSTAASGRHSVTGTASWYCSPARGSRCTAGVPATTLAAAAGPALRQALGLHWRGARVTVCRSTSVCVTVALRDWCACPRRVVDLYASAFSRLAPLSRGLVQVRVSW